MEGFKNRHLISHLRQIACTCHAGGAGTDHGYLPAVGLFRSRRNEAILSGPVCNETLQLTDGDRLALDSADTLAFTLALLRAHTAADRRKCGGFCYYLCGFLVVAFLNLFDKARNVDGNGTSAHALRILAL